MIQKKIHPIIVVLMMLFTLAIAPLPLQADLHRVSGYLYIDGNPAPADVQVVLSFDDGDETDYTSSTGHYEMSFNGHDFEIGYFNVFYNSNWYEPDPASVFITQPAHGIDLNVDTGGVSNSPPNTPSVISPSNGGVGIGINADLIWSGGDPDGDPVTYDIYIGEDSSRFVKKVEFVDKDNDSRPVGSMSFLSPASFVSIFSGSITEVLSSLLAGVIASSDIS